MRAVELCPSTKTYNQSIKFVAAFGLHRPPLPGRRLAWR